MLGAGEDSMMLLYSGVEESCRQGLLFVLLPWPFVSLKDFNPSAVRLETQVSGVPLGGVSTNLGITFLLQNLKLHPKDMF